MISKRYYFITLLCLFSFTANARQVSHNEFMSSNLSEQADEIEFYNSGSQTINLNNTEFTTSTDSVSASLPGGFYSSSVTISLSAKTPDIKIYYTLDGAEPTLSSKLYKLPILIGSTTVLRARAFKDTMLSSYILTNTYLIKEDLQLPVLSITTDPPNLWDEDTGIYVFGKNYSPSEPYYGANFWQDWEKPAHLEFFETDGRTVLNQDIGIKIFGTWSRAHPQRSFSIIAREKYGKSKFNYRIFPDLNINKFQRFILRNGGNDFGNQLIRDEIMQRIIRDNTDIDHQEYRPADVFLNGEYWGIYCVREKISEDYIAAHHYVNPDSIDLLEFANESEPLVISGSNEEYNNLVSYISANPLANRQNYEYIKTRIDLDNFIDYEIAEIYFNNTDWPGNNNKFWKSKNPDSRWRWIFFGAEFGLGLYNTSPANNSLEPATEPNGPSWPNPPSSTFLLRKLLENNDFKNEFITRFADHINITFEPGRVLNIIDKLKTEIRPEMPRNIERWNRYNDERFDGYASFENWINGFDYINDFVQERPGYVCTHIIEKFGLTGTSKLSFDILPSGSGNIKSNRLFIPKENWTGTYFQNMPITVTAVPKPGYRFKNWSGANTSTDAVITLIFSTGKSLTANFEAAHADTSKIIINEINYNSLKEHDSEDWIEIYNNNDVSIDLSNWKIKDSDSANVYILPQNTILAANGYLVACKDKKEFTGYFPSVKNMAGDLGFGFSAGGELISLLDPNNKLVDSVEYADNLPWPTEADGNGATLELKDPGLDNAKAENWSASKKNFGTPGEMNSCLTGIEQEERIIKKLAYRLEQNYPNPFNPVTRIRYSIPKSEHLRISIFDLLGREISVLIDEFKDPGNYEVEFNVRNIASGIYFYRMQSGNFSCAKKIIIAK